MTDKLPLLSGKEIIKALGKLGYTVNDQKGSHIHMRHPVRRPLDQFRQEDKQRHENNLKKATQCVAN